MSYATLSLTFQVISIKALILKFKSYSLKQISIGNHFKGRSVILIRKVFLKGGLFIKLESLKRPSFCKGCYFEKAIIWKKESFWKGSHLRKVVILKSYSCDCSSQNTNWFISTIKDLLKDKRYLTIINNFKLGLKISSRQPRQLGL